MFRALFFLLIFTHATGQLPAQQATAIGVPSYELPLQDNARLLANEARRQRPGRPAEFAVSLPVDLSPDQAGKWSNIDGRASWHLRIASTGAESLNLGFSRFQLPEGGRLYLSNKTTRYGPFTASDNEEHAEFWSPLLTGDRLLVEVSMPTNERSGLDLKIATVNHDFTGIAGLLSGACNVDVVCGAADGFPEVEPYRDAIRSVAAYTINGRSQCTGFLVNNVNQDGRPLFITAEHCRVTEQSAPSMVVYWNYQHDECRSPGSPASSGMGNGELDVFNTGARLLAAYTPTDFALLELDGPVNPLADAHFAGWSAELPPPTRGVATVHHPGVEEKRISISAQPTTLSNVDGEPGERDANFIRVPFWDLGTTEGGSSGAPLFDDTGLVRGHLFGGLATCNNDTLDIFGYFNSSWTGGATPDTRLSDWLDPCNSGTLTLGGLDQADLPYLITAREACLTRCLGDSATFLIRVGEEFAADSPVSVVADGGFKISAPATVSGGESFTLTLSSNDQLIAGTYLIAVTVGSAADADRLPITLRLTERLATVPSPREPAEGRSGVDPFYLLRWSVADGAITYDVQLSLNPDFTEVIGRFSAMTDTLLAPGYALPGGTQFYWRARGNNECGPGSWSPTATFVTDELNCNYFAAADLPVVIPSSDTVTVVATLAVTEDLPISSLAVEVGIEHSFIGDVSAVLISPAGTVVPLFTPPQQGLCFGSDLYATFTDDAALTAEEFDKLCTDGRPDAPIRVRARAPLDTLNGESARGTWQLAVTDKVLQDGGRIVDFGLRICAPGTGSRDLSVTLASEDIISCPDDGGTARLRLGADYAAAPELSVFAGDLPLDNYSFTYAPVTRLLEVRFTTWGTLGPGTFPLTFVLKNADERERRAVSTLTVLPPPRSVDPRQVLFGADRAYFTWQPAGEFDGYVFQLAETEAFDSIVLAAATIDNRLWLADELLPKDFYWRILTVNTCGSLAGPVRNSNDDRPDGLRDTGVAIGLSVFPNPTPGPLNVVLNDASPGPWRVTVFDAAGRELQRSALTSANDLEVDLRAFPPGAYYLRITGDRWGASRKVMLLPR